ncbi:MAG: hypothetical protein ACM3JC_06500 [Rudaea sp.]
MRKRFIRLSLVLSLAVATPPGIAQQAPPHMHPPSAAAGEEHMAPAPDERELVRFPVPLRAHTLANMRDHLQTLAEIQELLGAGRLEAAGDLAEQRLGMSSLPLHGAADVAPYMPKGMQDAGTAMHRAASQFAIATRDASVSGDAKAPMAALARVTATCVSCHAKYRLE